MNRYLGTIRITNFYVNFYPLYKLENGKFTKISTEDRRNLFPESDMLNINLSSGEEKTIFADRFYNNQLFVIDLDVNKFELNINSYNGEINKTRYKINLDELSDNQYGTLHKFGYYYFLAQEDTSRDFVKKFMTIDNPSVDNDFMVVVETDDPSYVAGPFKVSTRKIDGEKVIVTHNVDANNNDLYTVNSFITNHDENEFQSISIEYDFYNNVHYVLFSSNKKTVSSFDVISDDVLLTEFKNSISNRLSLDGKLDLSDINSVSEAYKNSIYKKVPSHIVEGRIQKINKILTDEEMLDNNTDAVCQFIADIIVSQKNASVLEPVFEKLISNDKFMNSVPRIKALESTFTDLEHKVEEKQQELDNLETQIATRKDAEREEQLKNEYSELANSIDIAKQQLNGLNAEINELAGIKTKSEYLENLKKDVEYYDRLNTDRKIDAEIIEKNIDNIFSARTERAMSLTFDGMISQKMIQAAAEWESKQQDSLYESAVSALTEKEHQEMNRDQLIDYLFNSVRKYRETYDKNTILNLYICLVQGFLTVFSGAPGTGKTSACNIIAHTLGLKKPQNIEAAFSTINTSRFIDVSVERGWTSKRDFIGYYNPLTKRFDRNNSRLFDALNILDIEAKGKRTNMPLIVLLDEANLSPMEYYWADFMDVCDDRSDSSAIDLGENYRFNIPDELRFLATINNDHTTEALSPRLVDRAWVIKLPYVMPGTGRTTRFDSDECADVRWSDLVSVFGCEEGEITGSAKEVYDAFVLKARKIRIKISPRSDAAIRRYWSIASSIMEKDENDFVDPSIIALDYAISQKILPHINGSGETYKNGLLELKSFAREKNMSKTEAVLDEIITKGDETMMFYQYFG